MPAKTPTGFAEKHTNFRVQLGSLRRQMARTWVRWADRDPIPRSSTPELTVSRKTLCLTSTNILYIRRSDTSLRTKAPSSMSSRTITRAQVEKPACSLNTYGDERSGRHGLSSKHHHMNCLTRSLVMNENCKGERPRTCNNTRSLCRQLHT